MLFALLASRRALARNFRAHGRSAVRLYLVVSASLFIRASFVLAIPLGLDQGGITGPFLTTLSLGQYAAPLAIYEIYWRVRDHAGLALRVATAVGLVVLTLMLEHHPIDPAHRADKDARQNNKLEILSDSLRSERALGAGRASATMSLFVPELALAYENLASVADPVERALAQGGLPEGELEVRRDPDHDAVAL